MVSLISLGAHSAGFPEMVKIRLAVVVLVIVGLGKV